MPSDDTDHDGQPPRPCGWLILPDGQRLPIAAFVISFGGGGVTITDPATRAAAVARAERAVSGAFGGYDGG